ncbi:MAG: M23 family metallopeptidase [Treponema sp.]|jgi:murein DD-endopeptidase MepM/ murein hydrolase activator NlpD|nr:M23 family metallopeptidase [Treponema sp.]
MASVHEYKRLENKLVQKVKNTAGTAAGYVGSVFTAIGRFLTRRYTIVFVPHSEKRVYNLHVTILSVCCFLLVVSGIIGAFLWYGASYSSTMYAMANKDGTLKNTQASLDQLRDESANVVREARKLEIAFTNVLSALGINNNNTLSQNTSGDLSAFLGTQKTPEGNLPEIDDFRKIADFLAKASPVMTDIAATLDTQGALLTEIPSIWPIRGGIGHITMFFGQNIHPIYGQHYIHRGIDISTNRYGDPIVATADGTVVTAEYTYDYGNYIIVRHKHGYFTRYAHMQSFRASVGQRVQQNEVIGYIGNTGISTGPHVHYEVSIGSDVVDPYRYLTIRNSLARQGTLTVNASR